MKKYLLLLVGLFLLVPTHASVHYDNNTSEAYYQDVWETQDGYVDFYYTSTMQFSHRIYIDWEGWSNYRVEPGGLTMNDTFINNQGGPLGNGYSAYWTVTITWNYWP